VCVWSWYLADLKASAKGVFIVGLDIGCTFFVIINCRHHHFSGVNNELHRRVRNKNYELTQTRLCPASQLDAGLGRSAVGQANCERLESWQAQSFNRQGACRNGSHVKIALLKETPRNHALQLKRIEALWAARVGIHHRALGIDADDGIQWIWIGSHAEYDRLIG
jgi:hypothetical protein